MRGPAKLGFVDLRRPSTKRVTYGPAQNERVAGTILIGVDLGPNVSVAGSLATILWLVVLRRDGEVVGFWHFFRRGGVVMPPALVPSKVARIAV